MSCGRARQCAGSQIPLLSAVGPGWISLAAGSASIHQSGCRALSSGAGIGSAEREEIETTLELTGLKRYFLVVVAAEDFLRGKPHPESFLLALDRLNAALNAPPIRPEECLVIEDSVGGVSGARAAGMACMAVTNSYPREALAAANKIVASLDEVPIWIACKLFSREPSDH